MNRPTTPAGSKAVAGLVLGVIGLTLSLTGFAFCCPFAGVPFGDLVADAELLPAESIRFFYLDRAWTDALVQGVLSVGKIGRAHV